MNGPKAIQVLLQTCGKQLLSKIPKPKNNKQQKPKDSLVDALKKLVQRTECSGEVFCLNLIKGLITAAETGFLSEPMPESRPTKKQPAANNSVPSAGPKRHTEPPTKTAERKYRMEQNPRPAR